MTIKQGDIYWVNLVAPRGSEPGFCHPCVVIQNDVFNVSRIRTVVVCALTTNLKRAQAPGNVTLNKGEANLTKQSVANISQVVTVDKSDLKDKIGSLSPERIKDIIDGIKLLVEPLPDPRS
ncbi:MAG: type II toxin-antitoxin system PemK/MazF family toxin [Acidobacteria bacterium]|nr:type II toxin-antitoxin system PemK/MazF family toxin [Acidobacteriota bacterium]